ncbi:ADP-ribosylglycohydrolase family protein [Dictyobacter kobayashii]|uniref:ADP-ribosylglycohydrolase n=1 Tax=Dictyobacter kobayashii TaxID=2014872 RepID=A0A402AF28_9CHLR|nr:ADP-ribosylglycohydrolase family protein [Dictyobacter kobayashii]GCE17718.1 hypothetical protein KDK_15180 [Dictyobacter kobayashii]
MSEQHTLPTDYGERAYAGVLGKIIGVYLGRPFEGWPYERIMRELGEINYYVHEKLGVPLVVTDDDISGTFTFLRALADYHYDPALSAAQIGQSWLNYIIEGRTILWWGGMGNSTEHTAYLRLKEGIPAPRSGSIELNGKVVAEQIGAQIFIDGWALVSPGNPAQAVRLAGEAGCVSHDGEAVYAAQVIAAMEAQAFVESDIQKLLDTGLSFIPEDSLVYRMIQDIRSWHREESDWRKPREKIAEKYGYDTYGGGCHVIPNHALIIMALLYGEDDFQRSLMIVNTAGWDTDCNSANVGCLLGIKNGLRGIDAGPDWRGPVADRLYLPTADGGRAITDAVIETYHVVKAASALAGVEYRAPKNGARFHFSLPGSVQGFQLSGAGGQAQLKNVTHPLQVGERCLELAIQEPGSDGQALQLTTATFVPVDALEMRGYALLASPTLYSGQRVQAAVLADSGNSQPLQARLIIQVYNAQDQLSVIEGPQVALAAGEQKTLEWLVPDTHGQPIAAIGLALAAGQTGKLYLDYLTWQGTPDIQLTRPEEGGHAWQRAWVNGADQLEFRGAEAYRIMQNHGRGLVSQGTGEWSDYQVTAVLAAHMADAIGLAARVQGLQRYYALLLTKDGHARLVKVLDGEITLAETNFAWELDRRYTLGLQVHGTYIEALIDGQQLFEVHDQRAPLLGGGIGLICEVGRLECDSVSVQP